jgi:hypothetical protein
MKNFNVTILQDSSVLYIYTEREFILLDPVYQRQSDVWTIEKRQLLIDSIINEYDIPKIYFHEFETTTEIKGEKYKYAIIDGKQRLESIWRFIDGEFNLADNFEYLHDPKIKAAGLSYDELGKKYPRLKIKFDSKSLTIVSIRTDDIDLIEDMFSRLNEAVPLNAAEKRNAFGGPLPLAIREISKHPFFTKRLPFNNKRYRHYDLATKFLYLESNKSSSRKKSFDTKKVYIDEFVKNGKKNSPKKIKKLVSDTKTILSLMSKVFIASDKLLSSVGTVVVYYLLFRDAINEKWGNKLIRNLFTDFEKLRKENRTMAETDLTKADYDLLEYDRSAWSANDGVSIDYRHEVLTKHIKSKI